MIAGVNRVSRVRTGNMILQIALLHLFPLLVLPFYPEEAPYSLAFLYPAAAAFLIGLLIILSGHTLQRKEFRWHQLMQKGSGQVLFIWCFAFVVGAVPFVLGKQMGPMQALFESVSGWTTTGLTLSDVENMPHIFLFHRSFMQYCGGLGFVVMITLVLKGSQSMISYNAEGHPDQLRPSLRGTARVISGIYLIWLVAGSLLYRLCGMPLFSAVCHTMSSLSTAGFSTEADSIGAYHSAPIQLVTILLMLVGACNFGILLILMQGRLRQAFRESEVRFMIGIVALFTVLAALDLFRRDGGSFPARFLDALFGIVTTFSTTGYSTMDYASWPAFSLGLLAVLMIIGGCTGSTAGGLKMSRTYLILRIMILSFRRKTEPSRWVTAPTYIHQQRTTPIDEECKESMLGFFALYLTVLVVGILALSIAADCSLSAAAFEFTSALGTVGLSNGLTTTDAPALQLIIEIIAMVLGRLEIIMVFIGIASGVSRIASWFQRN